MAEAHVRIDEGIARGPRKRKSVPRRRDPETGSVQAIPPNLDHREVLQRYLTEQTTSQIAQSYGVTRKSLVQWLRQVAPQEWKAVQLVRAHDRKEVGNEEIETATDALSLARARESLRSAQWELTALDPDYQPKQQVAVTMDMRVQVSQSLTARAQDLIQSVRGAVQSPQRVIEIKPDEPK